MRSLSVSLASAAFLSVMLIMTEYRHTVNETMMLVEKARGELGEGAAVHRRRYSSEDYSHIIVIPDIHGDSEYFIRSLWLGLLDTDDVYVEYSEFRDVILAAATTSEYPDTKFSSNRIAVVQVGDVIDRGPDSVLCLHILWSIERVIGWDLVSLYGNHEVMSSRGINSEYIHPAELEGFGGLAERYSHFSPNHPLWDKITHTMQLVVKFESPALKKRTLFVHAGIGDDWPRLAGNVTLEELNAQTTAALEDPGDSPGLELLGSTRGPLWTRDLARMNQTDLCERILPDLLRRFDVNRIIVGHTPQEDHRMKSRCGSQIILVDCALSRWLFEDGAADGGQPAILLMTNDGSRDDWSRIRSIYFDTETETILRSRPVDLDS